MTPPLPRTLFVGRGNGGVCWYRCALPAMHLGQDWIGVAGEPSSLRIMAGVGETAVTFEDFARYEVVVLQYQASQAWLQGIRRLQAQGTRVLFEIDDYARSVGKKRDHAQAKSFGKGFIRDFELCMRVADGVICSTDWLATRYRSLNPRTWVCRNAIDLPRYRFTREPSPWTTIGWAGATGHAEAVQAWLPAVAEVMAAHPRTRFVSVGERFADALAVHFGPERCLSVPPSAMETYPAAMASFDVAVAPAGRGGFYQGKSDLRWLESSALGIPLVADPGVYPDIEPGVTGFHAGTPAAARDALSALVADPALRERVGAAAHAHVAAHRSMAACAPRWAGVLREAVAGDGVALAS
jgi:glycosyltransferase involved in cell wall biosynthesis